jgi:hypothetical protein
MRPIDDVLADKREPTQTVYVTYGCGSNLGKCFSRVEVPRGMSATGYVQSLIGQKYAFIYDEKHWVQNGVTQEDRYGLAQVGLQAQISGE